MKPHPRGHNGLTLTNSESYNYIYALKTVEELNKNGYAYCNLSVYLVIGSTARMHTIVQFSILFLFLFLLFLLLGWLNILTGGFLSRLLFVGLIYARGFLVLFSLFIFLLYGVTL